MIVGLFANGVDARFVFTHLEPRLLKVHICLEVYNNVPFLFVQVAFTFFLKTPTVVDFDSEFSMQSKYINNVASISKKVDRMTFIIIRVRKQRKSGF